MKNPLKKLSKEQQDLISGFSVVEMIKLSKKARSVAKICCSDCKSSIRKHPTMTVSIIEECELCVDNPRIISLLSEMSSIITKNIK